MPSPTCGAKTRAGTPCRRRPCPGRTRCRLHGGLSLSGTASPRFKHGGYSSHPVFALLRAQGQARARTRRFLAGHGYAPAP